MVKNHIIVIVLIFIITAGVYFYIIRNNVQYNLLTDPAFAGSNIITNNTFDAGTNAWKFYTDGTAQFTVTAGEAKISVTNAGSNTQLYQRNLPVQTNKKYRLSFEAHATSQVPISVQLIKHESPFTNYGLNISYTLETQKKTYTVEFESKNISTPNDARLMFSFLKEGNTPVTYTLDNIILAESSNTGSISGNVLQNSIFESDKNWSFFTNGNASLKYINEQAVITISNPGTNTQLFQSKFILQPNTLYELSFDAYSLKGQDLYVSVHQNSAPYTNYGLNKYRPDLTTQMNTFVVRFITPSTAVDPRIRFHFNDVPDIKADTYYIDNVLLYPAQTSTPLPKTPEPTIAPTATPREVTPRPTIIPTPTPSTPTPIRTPIPTPSSPIQTPPTNQNLKAFPGAEGFGAFAKGGRGGRIIYVTNLNDEGEGSLRAALEASGPRIVLFKVGGLISLKNSINIRNPYITIAGQTAPGDGITIRDASIVISTNDVIIRNIRVRPGDRPSGQSMAGRDGIKIQNYNNDGQIPQNIIIDHCSISWGSDENFSIWTKTRNITLQWSILAEVFRSNSYDQNGYLLPPHGAGTVIGDITENVSILNNFFANNSRRNPLIQGRSTNAQGETTHKVEVINNVIYNWDCSKDGSPTEIAPHTNPSAMSRFHIIGNFYQAGPGYTSCNTTGSTTGGVVIRDTLQTTRTVYVKGNIGPTRQSETEDEWAIVSGNRIYQATTPVFTPSSYTPISAGMARDNVLEYAGAIIPRRDTVDQRQITDFRNRTGRFITSQNQVGGWPTMSTNNTAPTDSDNDGMPDTWEITQGLNPNIPNNNAIAPSGYTWIEEYINSLIPPLPPSSTEIPKTGNTLNYNGTEIPLSDPEIANPSRGLFTKGGEAVVKIPGGSLENYRRLNWVDLEPEKDKYNFALIDSYLSQLRPGERFNFRIRALQFIGAGTAIPKYLQDLMPGGQMRNGTFIPDWNDPDFMERSQALLKALGARYDKDPRINMIDIGFYGLYGEWHLFQLPFSTPMTEENMRKLIKYHIDAFPNKWLLLATDVPDNLVIETLSTYSQVGIRRDNFANPGFTGGCLKRSPCREIALNQYKKAPFVAEYYGSNQTNAELGLQTINTGLYKVAMLTNGNLGTNPYSRTTVDETGKRLGYRFFLSNVTLPAVITHNNTFSITSQWFNRNLTPAYDDWLVTYELRNASGTRVWDGISSLNLRSFLPNGSTPLKQVDNFAIGNSVPSGTYKLHLIIKSTDGYRLPLRLANTGRNPDGSYTLGDITIR